MDYIVNADMKTTSDRETKFLLLCAFINLNFPKTNVFLYKNAFVYKKKKKEKLKYYK